MSPTRIIRPNPNVSAAPMRGESKKQRRSIAAVIRPVPTGSGMQGSLRLDEAEDKSVPKHHKRAFELDDYVDWLNSKLDRERLTATTIESRSAERETEGAKQFEVTKPISLKKKQRPSLSDAELARQIGAAIGKATKEHAVVEKPSSAPILRFDEPETPVRVLPTAHTKFDITSDIDDGSVEDSSAEDGGLLRKPLTDEETDSFVSTISKAIASVLTDQPEEAFEQQVRTRFESEILATAEMRNQGNAIEQQLIDELEVSHASTAESLEDELKLAPILDEPYPTYESSLLEAHMNQIEQLNDGGDRKEIPTTIAAWDVEDFRWPAVSNQMIVSGGNAIEQLHKTTRQIISPSAKRLAVSGLGRANGATSIAISLARWAAASGSSVLLVDADISNPNLSRQIGLAPNMSWINAGKEATDIAEFIVRSQKSGLCVMPLAPLVARTTWPRFMYDNLGQLIDRVQTHFDLIVMDMGPATQLMDELSQAGNLVDGTMLVHDGIDTPKFRKTKNLLKTFGLDKLIVTQNRIQQKSANVA